MAEFTPVRGLDELVAVMVAPEVKDIADRLESAAKRFAPATKTWKSMGDPLVRKEHRKADGQEVPENVRFVVDSPLYDRQHYGVGPQQLLRFPRDPDGSPGITINCRCRVVVDPDGLAEKIVAGEPVVTGPRVTVEVRCEHERAAEAEFGAPGDDPARFMGQAIAAVAAEMR